MPPSVMITEVDTPFCNQILLLTVTAEVGSLLIGAGNSY
jgi:hypothetical protein